jgi:hypothetical protein
MQHTFSFLLLLLSINLSGQIRGSIFDKTTGLPIQYANVFIKGLDIGSTSDKDGIITLNKVTDDCILIVSAIGYETQEINLKGGEIKIELVPKIYELPEIKVIPKKRKSVIVNGSLNKIKSKSFISPTGDYPWILTKLFPYFPEYISTPIIKQIKLMTICHLDSATFNVRLISADANGRPDNDLLSSNLIITAKKGENLTPINLIDYKISFPENGFFVAFEWLILDQNKVQNPNSKRAFYDPLLGIIPAENNTETWRYAKGQWYKSILYVYPNNTLTGQIAVELTLTN